MKEEQVNFKHGQTQEEEEINLVDILIILLKHKKLIISITSIVAILSIAISLVLPFTYEAKASIMVIPPKTKDETKDLYIYMNLLKSDSVIDNIIKKFDLMKLYKAKNIDIARKDVLKHLDVKADPTTDIITISYEDKDPKRSMEITNAFVEQLIYLKNNKDLPLTEVGAERRFFQKELKKAYRKLLEAEKQAGELEAYGRHIKKYINIQTELSFRKVIYETLLKLYQKAYIKEAKTPSVVKIVHRAVPPHTNIRKRALIVIVSTISAFFIAVFVAFIKEAIEMMSQNEEDKERLELLKQYASFKRKN